MLVDKFLTELSLLAKELCPEEDLQNLRKLGENGRFP